MDTIFALATAQGKAGVSVIRISGPKAFSAAERFCILPPMRRAGLRKLLSDSGDVIDEALVLAFPEDGSFTGEPVVEFQVHGSRAVVKAVLEKLAAQDGVRLAEPGEFTRRALYNNRLNLAEVEALGDLIDAETEMQRKQAQRILAGELSDLVEQWREDLLHAASLVELMIDFSDEDIQVDVFPEVKARLSNVIAGMDRQLTGFNAAERVRDGFEVAIVGRPNIGKSTLLNRLAGRKAALTSEIAGTTRDVLEVHMDIGGLPVVILDTAGLRESSDTIESLGIALAAERASSADLRVFLVEPGEKPVLPVLEGDIVVVGKSDIHGDVVSGVSGVTGDGVDRLLQNISVELARRVSSAGLISQIRHRQSVREAHERLVAAVGLLVSESGDLDLVAEEIRTATRRIDALVGRIDVESMLSVVFSRFCLGK